MSMHRICRRCKKSENIRCNFGQNYEAEAEFHKKDWHNCEECECEESFCKCNDPFENFKSLGEI